MFGRRGSFADCGGDLQRAFTAAAEGRSLGISYWTLRFADERMTY
jgi:hypothetical protein